MVNKSSGNLWITLIAIAFASLACLAFGGSSEEEASPYVCRGRYPDGPAFDTTNKGRLQIGTSGTGELTDINYTNADSWTFEGKSGQSVSILVQEDKGSDPHLIVLDPDGAVIADDDDSGGGNSPLVTLELAQSGIYTVCVDMYTNGPYTLSLK